MIAGKVIKTHNITSRFHRLSGMNVKPEFQQSPLLNPESKLPEEMTKIQATVMPTILESRIDFGEPTTGEQIGLDKSGNDHAFYVISL